MIMSFAWHLSTLQFGFVEFVQMLQPPIPIPPEQMEAERKKMEAEIKKQQQAIQQQLEQQRLLQHQQQQQQQLSQKQAPSVVVQSPSQNGNQLVHNDSQGSDLYSKGTYRHK